MGLCVPFTWFTFSHLDFVPIWDGWAFTRECFQAAASSGQFRCFGHPAYVPSALYGLTQLFRDGTVVPIFLINLTLGVVGIGAFRWLIKWATGDRFARGELTLLAFALGLWPTFQIQMVQPGLDYPMTIFFILMLAALVARRYIMTAIVGLAMSFCKEPGIVLYGSSVGLYMLFLAFDGPSGFSFKRVWTDRLWILALPAIPVVAYVLNFPPQHDAVSWKYVIQSIFSFNFESSFFRYQLLSAYVINFAWIFSLMGILGFVLRLAFWLSFPVSRPILPTGVFTVRVSLFVLLNLFALSFLLTRVEFANNPRYILALLPLLVFLASGFLVLIPVKMFRVGILMIILVLEVISTYRTIDPIAKAKLETFKFGSHSLLQMSVPENRRISGRGRDQLMYNGEILNVHYLIQDLVRKHGLDAVYFSDWCMTWIAFDDFRSFDVKTMERTLSRGSDTRMIDILIPEDFKERFSTPNDYPKKAYFIRFPNADICNGLREYSRYYHVAGKERFCRGGYCLSVFELRLK